MEYEVLVPVDSGDLHGFEIVRGTTPHLWRASRGSSGPSFLPNSVGLPTFEIRVRTLGKDWFGQGDAVKAANVLQACIKFLGPMKVGADTLMPAARWGKLLCLLSALGGG